MSLDPTNNFFMLYMAQVINAPEGTPMDLNLAQQAVYEAMLNEQTSALLSLPVLPWRLNKYTKVSVRHRL